MDRALAALYDSDRKGGLGSSAPNVARWLGDIREYFPSSVVRVMQQDALERLNLRRMLLEPEMLQAVEPDVHLVADLLALGGVMPAKTKETARLVVRRVVEDLQRRLAEPLRQAVIGSLNRAARNRRPRHNEIDWPRAIRANLKHYQPDYKTIIPETRIGMRSRSVSGTDGRRDQPALHHAMGRRASDCDGARRQVIEARAPEATPRHKMNNTIQATVLKPYRCQSSPPRR